VKTWTRIMTVGVCSMALAFVACGDDDNGSTPADTTQTDTSQPADTATTDTATADTSEADTTEPDPVTDACANAEDIALLQDPNETDPADLAGACGTSGTCLGQLPGSGSSDYGPYTECVDTCMEAGTANLDPIDLSVDCRGCFAETVACAAQFCLGQCVVVFLF
jgi:cytoskeletal protein RodZ